MVKFPHFSTYIRVVAILNTLPGLYACTTRLEVTASSSASGRFGSIAQFLAAGSGLGTRENQFGSYAGLLAMASTSFVRGSMAITAPRVYGSAGLPNFARPAFTSFRPSRSACSAARCRDDSMVRVTSWPFWPGVMTRSVCGLPPAVTSRRFRPFLPCRVSCRLYSSPLRPTRSPRVYPSSATCFSLASCTYPSRCPAILPCGYTRSRRSRSSRLGTSTVYS